MFEMGAKLSGNTFDTAKNKKIMQKVGTQNKKEHQLVFTYEKRRGKAITLVGRFYISEDDKKAVLKLLKKKLACGGAIKDEWIELQGDVKSKVIEILKKDDWKFKS